jgi:hypothetical protein
MVMGPHVSIWRDNVARQIYPRRHTGCCNRRILHQGAISKPMLCGVCPRMQHSHGRVVRSFSEALIVANSYQGELLGLIAIHLILLSINKIHLTLAGSVEIVSDCLGALKRVTHLPPYQIPSRCQHSDILKTILVNCRDLTFTTYYSHIKVHQDDQTSFSNLSRKAQLNCICDQSAKH